MYTKIRYRLVWNRKKELNSVGEALVQIEALKDKKKTYIRTNIYLPPHYWDKQKKLVINHPQAEDLNAYLYQCIMDIQAIEIDHWKRGKDIDLQTLRELALRKETPAEGFYEFAERVVTNSDRKEGTKSNLFATIKALKEFKAHLAYEELTPKFIFAFERWLRGKDLQVNTANKHLRQLRTLTNAAIAEGYVPESAYPFKALRLKREKKEHDYLREEEVNKLESLAPKLTKKEKQVCYGFLFCCYTGLRFSDLQQMSNEMITRKGDEIWYEFKTVKTGVKQKLPLHLLGKAKEVLEVFGGSATKVARVPCNSNANMVLKKLAERVGIERRVTFHLARHTFATTMLTKGLPMETIQHLLGHTEMRTTNIYAEKTSESVVKDLSLLMANA